MALAKSGHSLGLETQAQWWQHTSIYQIYPRSFQDSNGDGIGDLRGIIARLDHIQSLGIETIWISPFYASPQVDFGYDISDYYTIAPEFGTLEDVTALIAAVHARGMKIVFDMVLNHTSDQHPWFLASAQSRDNPMADWYIWRDGRGKDGRRPPTNWQSLPGGNGWQYCAARGQWYFASFLPCQPDLNYHHPPVRAAMMDVLRHWLGQGVDGFRLDIFNAIIKDKSFKDNPFSPHLIPTHDGMHARFQRRTYTVNHPQNFELAREVRAVVDTFPDRFLIGEVFGEHPEIRKFLGRDRDGLNLIFLFDMLFVKWTPRFFRDRLAAYEQYYAPPLRPTFVLGNHDTKRAIMRVGGDLDKAKLLALLQMTTRGVPVIYYGEEIGMRDAPIPKSAAQDPVSRMYGWVPDWLRRRLPIALNRDVCRTPMQWDASTHAGFCAATVQPWLPISTQSQSRNVATQAAQPDALLHVYRTLLHLRKQSALLRDGSLTLVAGMPRHVLAYQRDWQGQRCTILVNFGKRPVSVTLTGPCTSICYAVGDAQLDPAGRSCRLGGLAGAIVEG